MSFPPCLRVAGSAEIGPGLGFRRNQGSPFARPCAVGLQGFGLPIEFFFLRFAHYIREFTALTGSTGLIGLLFSRWPGLKGGTRGIRKLKGAPHVEPQACGVTDLHCGPLMAAQCAYFLKTVVLMMNPQNPGPFTPRVLNPKPPSLPASESPKIRAKRLFTAGPSLT